MTKPLLKNRKNTLLVEKKPLYLQKTTLRGFLNENKPNYRRVGPAKVSGRLENEKAFVCPVCTKFITSGAVNGM